MMGSMSIRSDQRQPFGKRLAQLRSDSGWTQQALANRLAISRVAISQIEMDVVTPSERTVTLLAGIFKLTPHELVDGTLYPQAKIDRLPQVAASYTQLELELALLDNDLAWLRKLEETAGQPRLRAEIQQKWRSRLTQWEQECIIDENERALLAAARSRLRPTGKP